MRAVRTNRKLQLEKDLVGRIDFGSARMAFVTAAPELSPNLGELARPEGQGGGNASILLGGVVRVVGRLHARSGEPAFGELVLARDEPSSRGLDAVGLVAPAAEKLAPQGGGAVIAVRERFPAKRRVDCLEARHRVRRRSVRARPVGETEIEIRGVAQVAEYPVVPVVGEIAALLSDEQSGRIPPEDLCGDLREGISGQGHELGERHTGSDPPFLASQEVDDREGRIRPREDVQVKGVDFAERHAHPAHLGEEAPGQRGEGQEAFLHLDALLTEGKEEIGSPIRVDDRLNAELGFTQIRVGQIFHLVLAGDGKEVPDHRDAGVEVVRRLAAAASRLRRRAVGWGRRRGRFRLRGNRKRERRAGEGCHQRKQEESIHCSISTGRSCGSPAYGLEVSSPEAISSERHAPPSENAECVRQAGDRGGERPGSSGVSGANAGPSAHTSKPGRTSGGTRKTGTAVGTDRTASAQATQGRSGCGTNGAWAGWSGGKRNVPCESVSPACWCSRPPQRSASKATRTISLREKALTCTILFYANGLPGGL